jgi:hypothetical protein
MIIEDIIRMARECGLHLGGPPIEPGLAHFATLAHAAGVQSERERITQAAMLAAEKAVDAAIALEREACAEVCLAQLNIEFAQANIPIITHDPANIMAVQCAAAIRARRQK